MASISDISYLLVPRGAVVLSTMTVAPLLSVALCVPAWRVALRGAVRGAEPAIVLPMGLGAGIGLAAGPQLTIAAAIGGTTDSAEGWVGYLIWSLGMVGVGLAVAWWTCGTARLAVPAALGVSRGPMRALATHVVVTSFVVALWLSVGAQARLLLTNLGPELTWLLAPWDVLPGLSFGFRLAYLPLLLAALLLVLPTWAYVRTRRSAPGAAWPWQDGQPAPPGDLPDTPEATATRPPLHTVLVVGAGAGAVAGGVVLAVLLAGELLPATVRTSDSFALALGTSVEWAVLAAGLVAGVVAVVILPRLWWPLSLASCLVSTAVAAAGGWVLLTANRYGLLQHSDSPARPLGFDASLLLLIRPAARAVVPCVLAVAIVASLRSRRRRPAPASRDSWMVRSLIGGLVAALACGLLLAPKIVGVLGLQTRQVETASMQLELPVVWTANVDPASGQVVLDAVDGEVRVVVAPIPAPGAPVGADALVVGGIAVPGVGQLDFGPERWWVYEGPTPAGAQRVVIIGQPSSVNARQDEINELLRAVRWKAGAPRE